MKLSCVIHTSLHVSQILTNARIQTGPGCFSVPEFASRCTHAESHPDKGEIDDKLTGDDGVQKPASPLYRTRQDDQRHGERHPPKHQGHGPEGQAYVAQFD